MECTKEEIDAIKTAMKLEECIGKGNIYLKYINAKKEVGFVAHKKNEKGYKILQDYTSDGVVPLAVKKKVVESLWKKKLLVHCGIDHVPVANRTACKTQYLGIRIRTDLFRGF